MNSMTATRSSRIRVLGWILVAVFLVGAGLWVVAMAIGDKGRFDHWVGWANILALPAGAIGTALVIYDRMNPARGAAEAPAPTAGNATAEPSSVQNITAFWGGTAQGTMGRKSKIVNLGPDAEASDAPPVPDGDDS